jgi:acylphosphatase
LSARSVRLVVTGRVQGVGFRDFVAREAQARGLRGWVRNRRDGSVEALIGGPEARVGEIVEVCRRGPRAARVDHVSAEEASEAEIGGGFSILPTA